VEKRRRSTHAHFQIHEDDMSEIRIILPESSVDDLSEALRLLTETICKRTGDDGSGGLGGEFGYGCNLDCTSFAMHRFCWCEQEDCPWCVGCDCDASPNPHTCKLYRPPERWSLNTGFVVGEGAPNFWHKSTGLKVWWYKYIGRGMRVQNPSEFPSVGIVNACIAEVCGA